MPSGIASGTTTVIVIVPLPIILALGWAIAALLILLGRVQRSRTLFGWGMITTGLMILLSPLSVYLYYAIRDGLFLATPGDLLLIALLAFLGGTVASLGASLVRVSVLRPSAALEP